MTKKPDVQVQENPTGDLLVEMRNQAARIEALEGDVRALAAIMMVLAGTHFRGAIPLYPNQVQEMMERAKAIAEGAE